MIPWVRTVGTIEGFSAFVLFCIAMPMKYIWQSIGKEEFFWIGLIHGILWMLYAVLGTIALVAKLISIKQWFLLGVFSMLPLGPLLAERLVLPRASSCH